MTPADQVRKSLDLSADELDKVHPELITPVMFSEFKSAASTALRKCGKSLVSIESDSALSNWIIVRENHSLGVQLMITRLYAITVSVVLISLIAALY